MDSKMDTKKIIGISLLAVGVLIIFFALYSSYAIFTAKRPAPEVFKTQEGANASLPSASAPAAGLSEKDIQKNIQNMVGEQIKGLLPADFIVKLLNLISWSILATILIWGGSRISGLGIKLLKA